MDKRERRRENLAFPKLIEPLATKFSKSQRQPQQCQTLAS